MKITQLIEQFNHLSLEKSSESDEEISYIYADSRKAEAGDIFCIYNSFGTNTTAYMQDAQKRGITTALISKENEYQLQALDLFEQVLVCAEDAMAWHGPIASLFMGHPSQKLKIIAVTGTNGKTSITYILNDIMSRNHSCGVIGTIQVFYANKVLQTGYTTPDPSTLQKILYDMVKKGVEYVFMEASSHGLKLGRLNGCHLQAAVFTNLTQDHLDFHEDMEDYLNSKVILFDLLEASDHTDKFAIISTYSRGSRQFVKKLRSKNHSSYSLLKFGNNKSYSGELLELSLAETRFQLKAKNQPALTLSTNLLGNFNFENVCLSYITARQLAMDEESLEGIIQNLKPVDGRFQIIYGKGKTRAAIVDYAHTPDALENVLKSLQEIPHSRLICLFGCGGDRDRSKRPLMGKIACQYADMIILTSDNPRTEDPEQIIDDIEKGIEDNYPALMRITNRKLAIQKGVQILPDKGFLLVAGKGHENYQIIGNSTENFSDTIEIQQAFAADESSRR